MIVAATNKIIFASSIQILQLGCPEIMDLSLNKTLIFITN